MLKSSIPRCKSRPRGRGFFSFLISSPEVATCRLSLPFKKKAPAYLLLGHESSEENIHLQKNMFALSGRDMTLNPDGVKGKGFKIPNEPFFLTGSGPLLNIPKTSPRCDRGFVQGATLIPMPPPKMVPLLEATEPSKSLNHPIKVTMNFQVELYYVLIQVTDVLSWEFLSHKIGSI